jgi:hypothetical protein
MKKKHIKNLHMEDIKKELRTENSINFHQSNKPQDIEMENQSSRFFHHNNIDQDEKNSKIFDFFSINNKDNSNDIDISENFDDNTSNNDSNIYSINKYNQIFNNDEEIELKSENNNSNKYINNNINNNIENDINNYLYDKGELTRNNKVYDISKKNLINVININPIFNIYPENNQSNKINIGVNDNNKTDEKIGMNEIINKNLFNFDNNNVNNIPRKVNQDQIQLILHNIDIILSFLTSFKGSIFLQNFLFMIDNVDISILTNTIFPHISKIMCLNYGNYFFQKLIKKLNAQQRLMIYQIIENNFLEIATDKSGTHSIQSLIETIETPLENLYLQKLLNKNLLLLINNENGYHIIMKLLLEVPENQRNNLNLFLLTNLDKIITCRYGAYCTSKFIINNSNLNLRFLLINNVKNNFKLFIFNKNSCEVIFLAIKKFGINNFEFIIQEIENNLPFLSLHPISYSFIVKFLTYLKMNEYYKFSNFIWNVYRNDNLIKTLCFYQNGNKLLKKFIEYSNNTQKSYIKAKIKFIKKSS